MIPPGGLVVDIGANIGQFRWFSEEVLRARRVVSVEPVAKSFEVLQRNFPVDVLRLAVATSRGVTMYYDEGHSTRASFARRSATDQAEPVPAQRLDDLELLRDEQVIDLLKIDTEGAELDVLQSGVECLTRCAYLLVELSVSRPSAGGMVEAIGFLRREVPGLQLVHLGHQFTEGQLTEAVDCLFVNPALAAQRAPLGAG
jgi:FkbM family methyltransferase